MCAMTERTMRSVVLALTLVLLVGGGAPQKPNTDARRHDVYIAGFFPYGKGVENSDTGRGVMPSVKLALDHVNEHSSILRNYRLHMWWNDTMCNAAVGVKAFFDMMHSGPHKLMLFGAACTHVTDPIAKASKHWHLTQLSYADTHPMFTMKNFPNFFRIVPSENAFNSPRLSLLREFNWTRVGTIYQNEPRYSLAHNRLVAELDSLSYQVVETQSFTNEVNGALAKLKEKDTRVILGNFDEHWARVIFCEAYRMEMFGRRYQWIIMGTYSGEWWTKVSSDSNCTVEEMTTALEQTILTDLLPLSTSGEITISGITADEYHVEYNSRRGSEYSRFHGYTYDGIWAVALAIQNVAHKIRQFKRNLTVIDFKYRDPLWERFFLDALRNTSFEGVTGPVRFYDNERKASILLKQFQEGAEVKVGEYNAATQHLDLTLGAPMRWLGKHPPKDRTLLIIEHTRVNKTAYAIFASLACCGIVMASVFLAFNIKYRNQRYIKMSSPHLNNLIIIGCMLTYTSIVFLGLDSGLSSVDAFPYICTARAWTLMAGFSLAFGAMFSKTWRVHSIFTDVKLNKKVIKDYQLFMVVGVLLAIDLIIMTTWQISDPFYRETKQLEPYPHPSSEDIVIIPENEYCASDKMTIFVGSIYAYKGLLMIFGAFLAWETRNVSIPALNDSRHVGLSVYNVAIMCICGAAVALVLADHQDAMFLIIGVFVMFCTTATLWLVFVPKMVELKRNPAGSIDQRCRATLRPMGSKTRRDSSASEMESKMKEVKANNSRYRKTLLDREGELQALIRRLGNEARELLDCATGVSALSVSGGGSIGGNGTGGNAANETNTTRLSVPLLRKDAPSATETSEITSLCSISSQEQFHSLQRGESQSRRRRTDSKPDINGTQSLSRTSSGGLPQNGHRRESVIEEPQVKEATPRRTPELHKAQTFDVDPGSQRELRRLSTKGETQPRRCSLKSTPSTPQTPHAHRDQNQNKEESVEPVTCTRRVSVPGNRGTPKRKPDHGHGTHVVAKSELWDTGNQHHTHTHSLCRCSSKSHQRSSRVSISTDEEDAPTHHRSVSERTRHVGSSQVHSNAAKRGSSGGTATTSNNMSGGVERSPQKKDSKLQHFQSTPNVNSATLRPKGSAKHRQRDIYNATSESELLDREILPIFQKLLTERNKSQHNIDYSFGRSCPNISIKCDIVEYL